MSKTKRLPTATYKHASEIAELLSNPDTPEDLRERIEDALLEYASAARVTVFHPQLVHAAFLQMVQAQREAYFADDKTRVSHMRRASEDLNGLIRAAKEGKPLPASRDERPPRTAPVVSTDAPDAFIVRHRIAELERRLDSLYEPSDESARFKVEREIYDLRQSLESNVTEWPDVICAGGEQ